MDNKLYKMMNWPEIESVVYSECRNPERILGAHQVSGGVLIQAFYPGAEEVRVKNLKNDNVYTMECVDEEGFFAVFVPVKTGFSCEYLITCDGVTKTCPEVYKYIPSFWGDLTEKLDAGILYDSYRYFGAHFCERKGELGTEFITYAPGAERVSVVGDFNSWDGRVHQMCCIDERGIFGIFIPGLPLGSLYKFEIKLNSGLTYLKRDPFARALEKGEGDACVVASEPEYNNRSYKRTGLKDRFSILNISIEEFKAATSEDLFTRILDNTKKKGFDAVLFPDLTKCDYKIVTDYGTVSFFATNPSLIGFDDLKSLIDRLHKEGVKVLFTVEPAGFIADNGGLRGFDGTRLFEGNEKEIAGRLSFDFSKPFVRNYLISACDFFTDVFCVDGLCIGGMDRILYLDYGKFDGEWMPNIYGGNENLNGIEFLKHLNSILHKKYPGLITVAKDSLVSNTLTLPLDEGGMGFDYKFHTQFDTDLLNYLNRDASGRRNNHFELTYSPVYIFCERFILSLLSDNYSDYAEGIYKNMPYSDTDKKKNLRLLLSYMYLHPGRKCLTELKTDDDKLDVLVTALNELYNERDELSEDTAGDGFEWVNAIDSEHSVIAFLRKNREKKLLAIANFSGEPLNFRVGLEAGTYKEIFASEQIRFGGEYKLSGKAKQTSKVRCDGKEDSLSVKLAPFCIHVFEKSPCQNI
ncbi:MAG: alpha amylase C-terminal domain-containing protein [Lachnospiraceae bacterium]|nr:alpha amylase C-terminal domain-containing protein [Lachnospiraceae bacterium]